MKKILCVDDDPSIRKLLSELLKRAGYEVVLAKDGLDAMVQVKQDKPDLLLLDIMMPEFNGYDVCHNVKADNDLRDIPIILLTSRDREIDPQIGGMMGVEYLHKSCLPGELIALVNKLVAKKE